MSETRICANCGAEHSIEDMFEVEGDWLCEDCADRLTVICDHCAERVYEENAVEDDTHTLCDTALMSITSAARTATALFTVTARTGTVTTTPTACPAGMSTARSSTNTATHQTLFFHGKGLRHFGVETRNRRRRHGKQQRAEAA